MSVCCRSFLPFPVPRLFSFPYHHHSFYQVFLATSRRHGRFHPSSSKCCSIKLLRPGKANVSPQTTELVSRIGAKKARMRIDKMFINSFMGGCLISFGCALALSTNASPWFQTNAPGLIRTISAMVFPVGLIMVVLTGADLFTSYCMYSVVAWLHRRCSFLDLLKTWFVSFFGNMAGALFFMAVLTGCKSFRQSGLKAWILMCNRWWNFRIWCIQGRSYCFRERKSCYPRMASDFPEGNSL
jgi:hypothetical protein